MMNFLPTKDVSVGTISGVTAWVSGLCSEVSRVATGETSVTTGTIAGVMV